MEDNISYARDLFHLGAPFELRRWIKNQRGKPGWRKRKFFYLDVINYVNRFETWPPLNLDSFLLKHAKVKGN